MADHMNSFEETAPPPRPRWVKGLLLAVGLVALLLIVLKVAGVEHGPSRHGSLGPASQTVAAALPSSTTL